MTRPADLLARLNTIEHRLARHAARPEGLSGLTQPDPPSGERWEAGQVFAHVAEFGGYWVEQASTVLRRYQGDPVPFGRVKSDPARLAAIARDHDQTPAALMDRCRRDIAAAQALITGIDDTGWAARGVHPTLGVMDMGSLLDEFIVGHYEEHCGQLDGLSETA